MSARVWKRKKDRNEPAKEWWYTYRNEHGREVSRKGFLSKADTQRHANKQADEARQRRLGYIDAQAERYAQHDAATLATHLADWKAFIIGKGKTETHATLIHTRAARVAALVAGASLDRIEAPNGAKAAKRRADNALAEACGSVRIADLTAPAVQAALATIRGEGRSIQTVNHYLSAIKGFSRWLWRTARRTRDDALTGLEPDNAAKDRRHERRALTVEEAQRLIAAAEAGPPAEGMTGPDRAMLYRVALYACFRADELRSLTPDSFRLDTDRPAIVCGKADTSTKRHKSEKPIQLALRDALRAWLATKPRSKPVFTMPKAQTARMLRCDLEAAGIPYRDAAGRVVDFHALRHTSATWMMQRGASIKTIQTMGAWATSRVVLERYAKATLDDLAAAAEALPDLTRRSESA